MPWTIDPITLCGDLVRAEPLSRDHVEGLIGAVRDGRMWDRWYTSIPQPDDVAAEVDRRIEAGARGELVPFTLVRQGDDQVLGMSTYCNLEPEVPRLEIGWTWIRESAHGTGVNPESKLLMLRHAFETLRCESVCFKTQWSNQQSRAAIERLGAKQDGVIRASARRAGILTDQVVYSVIRSEWPAVERGLLGRLARPEVVRLLS